MQPIKDGHAAFARSVFNLGGKLGKGFRHNLTTEGLVANRLTKTGTSTDLNETA